MVMDFNKSQKRTLEYHTQYGLAKKCSRKKPGTVQVPTVKPALGN